MINAITFSIVNFRYLCSNIPSSPVYGVFVSQLIRYIKACSSYEQFLRRDKLLTIKHVDKTGLSTVSFEVIFSYVLWSIQRPCQQIQSSTG